MILNSHRENRTQPNYSLDSSESQTRPLVRGGLLPSEFGACGCAEDPDMTPVSTCLHFYLHGQAECVEHDEDEHHVFERRGVHHVPELVLVRVFGDVSPQGTCFQGVFNTLTLQWQKRATRGPEYVYRGTRFTPALEEPMRHLLGRTRDDGENCWVTPQTPLCITLTKGTQLHHLFRSSQQPGG